MSVLNEMMSEIRFIKLLAYEDQWVKRALDERSKELKAILQSMYLPHITYTLCQLGALIAIFKAVILI
jgi:hypothetical protein